jgi:hypothetical protein
MSSYEQDGSAVAELENGEKSSVGGSIRFWISDEGQAMIESFGNWPGSTALSCWLAQAYPRFYGIDAGLNNMWGQNNSSVAAFAQSLEIMHGADSPECQTLAAALNLYARDPSLHI